VERGGAWLAKRLRDRYTGDQLRLRTGSAALTGIGVGIVTGVGSVDRIVARRTAGVGDQYPDLVPGHFCASPNFSRPQR
jgi:hypothetical protein